LTPMPRSAAVHLQQVQAKNHQLSTSFGEL
jgi:hypothetical protein